MQIVIDRDLLARVAVGMYLLTWGILMPSWAALLWSAPSALYLGYRFLVPHKIENLLLIAKVTTEEEGHELFEACKEGFEQVLFIDAAALTQALQHPSEDDEL